MSKPKTKRNINIYLAKMGYKEVTDTRQTLTPITYRQLSQAYDLSTTYLQIIVNRLRNKYRPSA